MINLKNTHRPQTEPSPASDLVASARGLVKNYGVGATAARTPRGRAARLSAGS